MSATLHDARLGFRFTKQTENKSKNTILFYEQQLARFDEFMEARKGQTRAAIPLGAITTDDARQFIAYLQGVTTCYAHHRFKHPVTRPLSPYTIRGIVASLSAFFGWAVAEGLIDKSPMDKIAKPKVPQETKDRFSEEDVEKLLQACKTYPVRLQLRNRAIILFLLDTGVRAAELCALTVDHLQLTDERWGEGRAKINGKGMKERDVYFGKATQRALWQYRHTGRPESYYNNFFLTVHGLPIRPDELTRILRRLGEIAEVPDVHPHRFRHTAARLFIRNGGGEFALQAMLGHADLKTTLIYSKLERDDLQKAHERASPVDRWGLK